MLCLSPTLPAVVVNEGGHAAGHSQVTCWGQSLRVYVASGRNEGSNQWSLSIPGGWIPIPQPGYQFTFALKLDKFAAPTEAAATLRVRDLKFRVGNSPKRGRRLEIRCTAPEGAAWRMPRLVATAGEVLEGQVRVRAGAHTHVVQLGERAEHFDERALLAMYGGAPWRWTAPPRSSRRAICSPPCTTWTAWSSGTWTRGDQLLGISSD